jgi:hypothetical protein
MEVPGDFYDIRPVVMAEEPIRASWALAEEKDPYAGIAGIVTPEVGIRLHGALERIAYYFRREFHYDFVQFSSHPGEIAEGGYVGFLWRGNRHSRDMRSVLTGGCCFRWREYSDAPAGWALQWIWFHPYERRRGNLTQAWPYFQSRFGDFHVEGPFSPAMVAFLRKPGVLSAKTRAFLKRALDPDAGVA